VHPELITHIAYWCSPKFAVKIGKWINEWRKFSDENEIRFYDALSNMEPSPNGQKEKEIQKMLHKKLGAEIEVETCVGRIDLLTNKCLIEIKNYHDWKSAVGQLLMYSYEYDHRKKVMYLFDVPGDHIDDKILKRCQKNDISIKVVKCDNK
jgi:hypothetical protein